MSAAALVLSLACLQHGVGLTAAVALPTARLAEPMVMPRTDPPGSRTRKSLRERIGREGPAPARRFMIGIAGVLMQAAPLRPRLFYLDPRDVGRSVAMGGLGLFGRMRLRPLVGLELEVSSGSVRYGKNEGKTTMAQDQVLADLGLLLYLSRGDIFQLAFSGGLGGLGTVVRYETQRAKGRQSFGAFAVRAGVDAEFLLKRVALILSFRAYGLAYGTHTRTQGALFEDASGTEQRPPVPGFATMLLVTAGIAYRF